MALGYGIYKGAIRINLANFFKFSGIALILVAARVFKLSLGEFEELGFIDHLTVNVLSIAYLVSVLPLYLSKPKPVAPAEAAKKISLAK